MNRLSLTMPSPGASLSGRRSIALVLTLLATIAGLALACLLWAAWPLALALAAMATLGWLINTQPLVQHVEYFSADEDGLRYVYAPGLDGRVLRYKWTEVLSVSAVSNGLSVQTGRGALKGAKVFLAMQSEADCQAASAAAERWLSTYRV